MRNRLTQNIFLILCSIFFSLYANSAYAAPYGSADKNTVYDRLVESDIVIYGKVARKVKVKKGQGLIEIKVYDPIKGGTWKKGDFFYVNSSQKLPEKSPLIIYLFNDVSDGREVFEVNAYYEDDKNGEMFDYTTKVKAYIDRKADDARLRWLYSQVDSKNKLIAWDSYAQLDMASYQSLKSAAPAIDKESLRYLLGCPRKEVNDSRKGFYAFLLGLAQDRSDSYLLRKIIENPANKNTEIIRGAYMGYGLLRPDYPEYFTKKISSPDSSENMQLAIVEAVGNLIIYEKPNHPELLIDPLVWALKNGNRKVTLKAIQISADARLAPVVKYMRDIYFNKFAGYPEGKIAVVNYLKFVRKKTPDARRLLNEIKKKEKDRKVLENI